MKRLDIVELQKAIKTEHKSHSKGTRGVILEVFKNHIEVQFGFDYAWLQPEDIKVVHSSQGNIESRAERFTAIRDWSRLQAVNVMNNNPRDANAMRVFRLTQPFVTSAEAYAQMERVSRATRSSRIRE